MAIWCEELTHWKRPWCWKRSKAGEEGDDRGWDKWMASPTRWTWIWASSRRWWRTEDPRGCSSRGRKEWDVIERLNSSNVKKTTRLSLPILIPTPPKDWYLLPHRCAVNVSNTLSTSLPSRANDYLMVLHPCHCFSGPCTMW